MLRIGTSGWMYKHWREVFYPRGVPQKRWLEFYAQHFDTVEINASFYRLPTSETFGDWRQRVPGDFRYSVKGSRFVTHIVRLKDPADSLKLFFERVEALGDRTGPILWQLPPNFRWDQERLRAFLDALPDRYRHTVEFRHESWLNHEVFGLLERRRVALCIPESPRAPRSERLTTNWTYLRFHEGERSGYYTEAQMDYWTGFVRRFLGQGVDVWAYFNNDPHGNAIKNARELLTRLKE